MRLTWRNFTNGIWLKDNCSLKIRRPFCQVVISRNSAALPGLIDAATPFMIRLDNLHLLFTAVRARCQWGLAHGQDLEQWGEGIRMLEEWYYFVRPEPRMGSMQMMRYIPAIRKASGIFHYRLGIVAR